MVVQSSLPCVLGRRTWPGRSEDAFDHDHGNSTDWSKDSGHAACAHVETPESCRAVPGRYVTSNGCLWINRWNKIILPIDFFFDLFTNLTTTKHGSNNSGCFKSGATCFYVIDSAAKMPWPPACISCSRWRHQLRCMRMACTQNLPLCDTCMYHRPSIPVLRRILILHRLEKHIYELERTKLYTVGTLFNRPLISTDK